LQKAKHDQLAAAHGPLQDELASMKDKKAKAEKEVVLRRTELQSAMESSSRVNVVQLERIRHLTSLNEELKGKVAELTLQLTTERRATQAAAAPMLRQVSSWTEGVGPQPSVDESHLVQPAPLEASTNTVASEVVRLQAEKKTLEEKVLAMQHDVETLENQLFERSSELQHVLELHAHCNQALTAKAGEVSKAQEEIVRLQMLTASQEQRNDGNDREDAEQMVAMMQRNLDEMQDEVTQLQTKNNQLRDAKAKVETELCKRMAELKRGASWTGPTQAQMDELTQQTRHQADHIADLQTQLESMQLDLAKAKEDASSSPAQVRSVLNTHFPTQMQADAVEMVRQTTTTTKQPPSAAMDSEVGYLKQQVRELRDQKERIQDELTEKTVELQRALDMHSRMQRDSVQQLNEMEATLEADSRRTAVLQAKLECLEMEKFEWDELMRQGMERTDADAAEKKMLQDAMETLRKVNEEVVVARIEEANAQHSAEIMSLKSDMETALEENEALLREVKELAAKASFENSDMGGLKSQIQELKHEIQHLQYELSEKTAEMDALVQRQGQNDAEVALEAALQVKTKDVQAKTDELRVKEEEL
ncbi:hypothetical protein As57867_005697, partial [Aphanomyces stellatus]